MRPGFGLKVTLDACASTLATPPPRSLASTRITAEDVEEIVQMRVEAMVESLKKQRQMQQQQAQKNLDASKGSITGGCEEEKENQNQNPSVESSASPDPSTASPSRNE